MATGAIIGGIAAALSVAGSATASIVANRQNRRIAQETNAANAAEAEKARKWQEEMWNKENEYSSPAQTMNRLISAGINPLNLDAFGSESSPIPSTSVPQMLGATMNPVNIPDPMSAYASVQNMLADTQLKKSQASSVDIDNKQVSDMLAKGMNPKEIASQYTLQMYLNEKEKHGNIRDGALADIAEKRAHAAYLKQVSKLTKEQISKVKEEIRSSKISNEWQPKIFEKQAKIYDEQARTIREQGNQAASASALNNAQIGLVEQQTETEKSRTDEVEQSARLCELRASLARYGIPENASIGAKLAALYTSGQIDKSEVDSVLKNIRIVADKTSSEREKSKAAAEYSIFMDTWSQTAGVSNLPGLFESSLTNLQNKWFGSDE